MDLLPSTSKTWTRLRRLGHGSFASVSLARYTPSGQLFAVKSVNLVSSTPSSIVSLENEIQILGSLSSPFIVSYLGHDTTKHTRNLHIEYMPGGTAGGSSPMDEKRVREYTFCITQALYYLHSTAGVVHGDVKGQNVLIGSGGAKLADFGNARRVGCCSAAGTPLWMAPEVARGEGPTPASDVWSMGCTVIEMAGGVAPWSGGGMVDVAGAMFRIGFGDGVPELPMGMSALARDFVGKCLRRDAGDRWSCTELLQHPFLVDVGSAISETSPRSVLENVNIEFGFDGSDGDEEEDDEDYERVMVSARERIWSLGVDGEGENWGNMGWEEVRGSEVESAIEERILNEGEGSSVCCCCCSIDEIRLLDVLIIWCAIFRFHLNQSVLVLEHFLILSIQNTKLHVLT